MGRTPMCKVISFGEGWQLSQQVMTEPSMNGWPKTDIHSCHGMHENHHLILNTMSLFFLQDRKSKTAQLSHSPRVLLATSALTLCILKLHLLERERLTRLPHGNQDHSHCGSLDVFWEWCREKWLWGRSDILCWEQDMGPWSWCSSFYSQLQMTTLFLFFFFC